MKGRIYAEWGIQDYWIVNVVDRVLEIYRNPAFTDKGWRYRSRVTRKLDESVSPLFAPTVSLPVSGFF